MEGCGPSPSRAIGRKTGGARNDGGQAQAIGSGKPKRQRMRFRRAVLIDRGVLLKRASSGSRRFDRKQLAPSARTNGQSRDARNYQMTSIELDSGMDDVRKVSGPNLQPTRESNRDQ